MGDLFFGFGFLYSPIVLGGLKVVFWFGEGVIGLLGCWYRMLYDIGWVIWLWG